MLPKTLILLTLLITVLSGCASNKPATVETPKVEIVTQRVAIQIYQPPAPSPVRLENVKWHVITKQNLNEKIAEIEKQLGGDFVVMAITPQAYENLSFNMQELRRFIRQQNEIIKYYTQATTVGDNEGVEAWLNRNRQLQSQYEKQQTNVDK